MKKFSGEQLFVGGVTVVIGIAIIYGFFLVGSPAGQRLMQFDKVRVADLQNITFSIDMYWQRNEVLPASLEDLQNPLYRIGSIVDPKTGELYEYQIVGDTAFEVCAVFESESEAINKPLVRSSNTFEHGIGRTCFETEVKISRGLELPRER